MSENKVDNILIEGARVLFPNFTGKETDYNREGDRNFCVLLDEEFAEKLLADGWNVKALKNRRDPDDPDQPYLEVSVGFKAYPPKIVLIGEVTRRRNELDEDTVEVLDWAEVKNFDLVIRPYHWEVNGKSGIKAYIKTLYATIAEDPLDIKYAEDLDQLPAKSGRIVED